MTLALGLRVVRGPDWEWEEQDGGSGVVGTVVEGTEGLGVVVLWDCGRRGKYRCGLGGKYDLRVLDSGPAGVSFPGVRCFGCRDEDITGYQWKCTVCPDYQLCGTCYMNDYHSFHHRFKCIINNKGHGYRMMSRFRFKRRAARGLFPGATVARGHNWRWKNQDGGPGSTGKLTMVTNWKAESYRGVVEVDWNTSARKNLYRVGHRGKVDLKGVVLGEGPLMYMDHLPVLGRPFHRPDTGEFMIGDRVKCDLNMEVMEKHSEEQRSKLVSTVLEETGVVCRQVLLSGEFCVRYSNNFLYEVHSSMMTRVEGHAHQEGGVVRMIDDMSQVYNLQKGHGEWRDDMALCLGQVGVVKKVRSNGDVEVQFEQFHWILNSACVDPTPDATPPDIKEEIKEEFSDPLLSALLQRGLAVALAHIVKLGDVPKIRMYLDAHPHQVNDLTQGHTALGIAIEGGHNQAVKVLVQEYHADVEKPDSQMMRPLHNCAQANNVKAAAILLEAGSDVNGLGADGVTPLMIASALDHVKMLKLLMAHPSINLNAQDGRDSVALLYGIRHHHSLAPVLLLDHGADPLALSNAKTSLHDAGFHDNLPAMEEIVRRCPEHLNWIMLSGGHTPLHLAAIRNSYSVVEFLCRQPNCNINSLEEEGRTALHCVAIEGHTDLVELLVGYGVDLNRVDHLGNTALHLVLFKKLGYSPNETLSPRLTKVKSELKRMLGAEPVLHNYLVLACFLAQEGTSVVKRSQAFCKTALELCPSEYRDVLRNFVNKPGHFNGRLKLRNGAVDKKSGKYTAESAQGSRESEQIHSFRQPSSIRLRHRNTLRQTSANMAQLVASSLKPHPPDTTTSSMMATTIDSVSTVATGSLTTATPPIAPPKTTPTLSTTKPTTTSYIRDSTTSDMPTDASYLQDGTTSTTPTDTSCLQDSTTSANEASLSKSVRITDDTAEVVSSLQTCSSITPSTTITTSIATSFIVNELNSAPLVTYNSVSSKSVTVSSMKSQSPLTNTKLPGSMEQKKLSLLDLSESADDRRNLVRHEEVCLTPPTPFNNNKSAPVTADGGHVPLCLVCEDECDVQLDPCGHITVCSKCGQRLKKCPTCKMVVQRKVPVKLNTSGLKD